MAKVKLNDVAIEARETWKQSKTDVPVVGLEHLEPDEIWLKRWDLNPDENTFTKGFKKGQLLFGRRRAYQKKMSVASCDGICSGDITVIAARPEKILPELLPFYLRTDSFFDFAVRGSGGSLSPRVKWSHISDYEFDLPPMEEQKKLAELLWVANDLKEKYKKAITATDEMLKVKFREMFGCVGNGERGMGNGEDFNAEAQRRRGKRERGKLRDLTEGKIESVAVKYGPNDEFFYIDISSVSGTFDGIGSCGKYLQRSAPSRAQQCVKRGDILLSLVRPNLRKMAIVDFDDDNHVASTGFCVIRPKPEAVGYLKLLLTSEEFTNAMMDVARGTSYPAVTNRNVMDFQIPIPPLALQREFVVIAEKAEAAKTALKKSIADIDQVMKGLISQ